MFRRLRWFLASLWRRRKGPPVSNEEAAAVLKKAYRQGEDYPFATLDTQMNPVFALLKYRRKDRS